MARRIRADSVEQARGFRAAVLDLADKNLEELPEGVLTLDHLEELWLTGNELKTIPASLSKLPRLRYVDLTRNPIESLPNIPGLVIEGETYLRCRDQVDPVSVPNLSDIPRTGFQTLKEDRTFVGLYVNDQWTPTPFLTISAGARYCVTKSPNSH